MSKIEYFIMVEEGKLNMYICQQGWFCELPFLRGTILHSTIVTMIGK